MTTDNNQRKVAVFDFGHVLFQVDQEGMYRKLFQSDGRSEDELQHFLGNVFTHDHRSLANNARSAADITGPLAEKNPEWAKYILAFNADQDFLKIITGIMPGMEDMLKELKGHGYELYGLTNWSGDTFDKLDAAYPHITGLFNKIVVSGKVGIKKPDPAFYAHAQKEYDNPEPANVYFFDDKPRNTTGAKDSVGWNGIVFKDASTVRKALKL